MSIVAKALRDCERMTDLHLKQQMLFLRRIQYAYLHFCTDSFSHSRVSIRHQHPQLPFLQRFFDFLLKILFFCVNIIFESRKNCYTEKKIDKPEHHSAIKSIELVTNEIFRCGRSQRCESIEE